MPLLNLRELLPFPVNPDNATDVVINGVHFNRTALELYNYTWYDNNTISNSSKCLLIFDNYKPSMLLNGSWVNSTSCYGPYYGIKTRGALNIALGSAFGITIMFTLMNLRKHGRLYIREDKRFRVIGRRWQWYWACFVAACGMISCFTGVDVDRDYLQSMSLILQSFFFCLMLPGTLAMVWEATRHWGSFQERQICDRDPYGLPQDDRRAKTEFLIPLVFYLFTWLHFFLVIPRGWGSLAKQHSLEQQTGIAEPSGTDTRLKAGGFMAVIAWLVIIYSLHHSLKHYTPRTTNLWAAFNSFCHYCPTKLFATIIILTIRIAYAIASAFMFDISIFKYNGNPAWPYTLGYGTCLLIIIIFEIAGWAERNEDQVILNQRRERGHQVNAELGYTPKPTWWSKAAASMHLSADERLKAMTSEVGGGRATARNISTNIELGNMNTGTVRNRSKPRSPDDPFRDPSPAGMAGEGSLRPGAYVTTGLARPGAQQERSGSDASSTMTGATVGTEGTRMTGQTLAEGQPQRIRSMLDI